MFNKVYHLFTIIVNVIFGEKNFDSFIKIRGILWKFSELYSIRLTGEESR